MIVNKLVQQLIKGVNHLASHNLVPQALQYAEVLMEQVLLVNELQGEQDVDVEREAEIARQLSLLTGLDANKYIEIKAFIRAKASKG